MCDDTTQYKPTVWCTITDISRKDAIRVVRLLPQAWQCVCNVAGDHL